jgi:flavorubredoxin
VHTERQAQRHEPVRIAPDTYAIQHLHGRREARLGLYVNSLVIRGRQPVVVDTGAPRGSGRWLEDVWTLVDPADVRWIVVTQDDAGHLGGLGALLERCPRATLVASWFVMERLRARRDLPAARVRGLAEGESLDVGDRELVSVRPPVYHGPATRGFFDRSTGVYWSSDAFGMPVGEHVEDARALPAEARQTQLEAFGLKLAPWARDVGPRYWASSVARVSGLDPEVIAGVHGPAFRGGAVGHALGVYANLPRAAGPGESDRRALDDAVDALSR